MPRPKKIGLDYFPVDTVFDEKIQTLESLFGNDGIVWILKFWQNAYRNENGEVNLSKYFGEVMSKNCRITLEIQQKIIDFCIEIKLIKETSHQVYTSNGIQKRIAAVSHDREEALKRYFKNKERTKETKKIRIKIKKSKVKDFGDTSEKYSEKYKVIFIPPSFEDFKNYCIVNNHAGIAERAFKGYEEAGWVDSRGKQIKSWKQKLQHVWFRNDNEDPPTKPILKKRDEEFYRLCKQNESEMQKYRDLNQKIPDDLLWPKWRKEYE